MFIEVQNAGRIAGRAIPGQRLERRAPPRGLIRSLATASPLPDAALFCRLHELDSYLTRAIVDAHPHGAPVVSREIVADVLGAMIRFEPVTPARLAPLMVLTLGAGTPNGADPMARFFRREGRVLRRVAIRNATDVIDSIRPRDSRHLQDIFGSDDPVTIRLVDCGSIEPHETDEAEALRRLSAAVGADMLLAVSADGAAPIRGEVLPSRLMLGIPSRSTPFGPALSKLTGTAVALAALDFENTASPATPKTLAAAMTVAARHIKR